MFKNNYKVLVEFILLVLHAFKNWDGKQDIIIGYKIAAYLSVEPPNASRALKQNSSLTYYDARENFSFVCATTIYINNSMTYTSTKRTSLPNRALKLSISLA